MRLIGLAVVVALAVFIGPLVVDTQEAGKVYCMDFCATDRHPIRSSKACGVDRATSDTSRTRICESSTD